MAENVSSNTKKRLPFYLEYLRKIASSGQEYVSSGMIANALNLGEVQVRKDLAQVSSSGKPKIGYEVENLIKDFENYLGYKELDNAVVFGAGKIGLALLDYPGFNQCGLNILRAFDIDKSIYESVSGMLLKNQKKLWKCNQNYKLYLMK